MNTKLRKVKRQIQVQLAIKGQKQGPKVDKYSSSASSHLHMKSLSVSPGSAESGNSGKFSINKVFFFSSLTRAPTLVSQCDTVIF